MLVVPDTNTLYADQFLEGPLVRTILAAEGRTNLRLAIPEVVLDELRGHIERELKKTVDDASKVRRDYARLRGVDPYLVNVMIDSDQRRAVLDRFEQRVKQLAEEKRILGYPSISPKELSQRAVSGQLPFQSRDRGLRDTLIWLTVKEYLVGAKDMGMLVALVTDDKAFLDATKSKLNESLARELIRDGISLDSIDVQPSLQNAINAYISSNLSSVEWVATAIEGGKIEDFAGTNEVVLLKVTDWILQNPEMFGEPHGPISGYLYFEFDVVEGIQLEGIERALDLGSGEVLVDSRWVCDAAVEGFDNPVFGNNLTVELEVGLSSIVVSKADRLTVRSHEVTDVTAVDFSRSNVDYLSVLQGAPHT